MVASVYIMKVHDNHCENFIMKFIVLFLIYDNKKREKLVILDRQTKLLHKV